MIGEKPMETDKEKWYDFIIENFSDENIYKIKEDNIAHIIISAAQADNYTTIEFIFSENNLEDIQFNNSFANGGSGELTSQSIQYNKENIFKIKNYLEIPIDRGWREIDFYFLTDHLYKTQVFYNKNETRPDFVRYHSFLSIIIGILTLGGILAKQKELFIPPIRSKE